MLSELNSKVVNLIKMKIDQNIYDQILLDLNGYTEGHTQKTDRLPTEQDRGVVALFNPSRLLDITKNFILFDAGTKSFPGIHNILQFKKCFIVYQK